MITDTITTTVSPHGVQTKFTRTRTTNPHLPIIGDLEHIRMDIAAYVGVIVGAELRHLRAVGPAIAAIDWAAHDQPWTAVEWDEDEEEEEEEEEEIGE